MEISGKRVDICWLGKVRGRLKKVEKKQQRIKQEKFLLFQVTLALKTTAFEWFSEHRSYFQFKADFLSYCSSQCPEFENIYTLTTLDKT